MRKVVGFSQYGVMKMYVARDELKLNHFIQELAACKDGRRLEFVVDMEDQRLDFYTMEVITDEEIDDNTDIIDAA